MHGFVPEAGEGGGLPGYEEEGVGDGGGGGGVGEEEEAPAYDGAQDAGGREVVGAMREGGRGGGETYPDLRWRGEEDGALAGHKQAEPGPMGEEEVRRINEERRKRVKAGGFTNWVLRRKGGRREGDGVGVGVVR